MGPDSRTHNQRRADKTWDHLCPGEFCPFHPATVAKLETHLNAAMSAAKKGKVPVLCTGCYYLFCALDAFTHHRCQQHTQKEPVPSIAVLQQRGIAFDARPTPDSEKNLPMLAMSASMPIVGRAPPQMPGAFSSRSMPSQPPPPTHHNPYQRPTQDEFQHTHHQQVPQHEIHRSCCQQVPRPIAPKPDKGFPFGQVQSPIIPSTPDHHYSVFATDSLGAPSNALTVPNDIQYANHQMQQPCFNPTAQASTRANIDFAALNEMVAKWNPSPMDLHVLTHGTEDDLVKHCLKQSLVGNTPADSGTQATSEQSQMSLPSALVSGIQSSTIYPEFTSSAEQASVAG